MQNASTYPTYLLITPLEVVLRAPWAVFLLCVLISSQPGTLSDGPSAGLQGSLCAAPSSPTPSPVNPGLQRLPTGASTASAWSPLPSSWAHPHFLQDHSPELLSWFLGFGQRLTCLKLESKSNTWCTIFFFFFSDVEVCLLCLVKFLSTFWNTYILLNWPFPRTSCLPSLSLVAEGALQCHLPACCLHAQPESGPQAVRDPASWFLSTWWLSPGGRSVCASSAPRPGSLCELESPQ